MTSTEKEIAEKVWGIFDSYRQTINDRVVGIFKTHALTATSQLEDSIEKILPRPKRKVKKEMWVNIGEDIIDGTLMVQGRDLYETKEQAEKKREYTLATAKVVFEMEEE